MGKEKFLSSGEINFTISQPKKIFEKVLKYYDGQYLSYDNFDGLSLVFKNWRFNLRSSNTEPLLLILTGLSVINYLLFLRAQWPK